MSRYLKNHIGIHVIYVFLISWIYCFMWPKNHKNKFHLFSNLNICPSTRHFLSDLKCDLDIYYPASFLISQNVLAAQEADPYHSFCIVQHGNIYRLSSRVHTNSCQGFPSQMIFINQTLQLVSSSYLTPEGKFEAGSPSVQLQVLRFQIFTDKEIAPPDCRSTI